MALWTTSYPVDAGERDPSFAWHDTDVPSAGLDESQHDLFAQFLDFEAGAHNGTAAGSEPFYLDQPDFQHHHHPSSAGAGGGLHNVESSTSSGVSTADDYDFLSSNPHPALAAGYEVDPSALVMFAQDPAVNGAAMYAANSGEAAAAAAAIAATVSDTELERLEGISLYSPKKPDHTGMQQQMACSDPSSPTLPLDATTLIASDSIQNTNATSNNNNHNTATGRGTVNGRRSKRFVEALSSTIRKATNMRKTRKVSQALQRAVSPSLENPPMAMEPAAAAAAAAANTIRGRRAHTQHAAATAAAAAFASSQNHHAQQMSFPVSPPLLQVDTTLANNAFVSGHFEDPFAGDISPTHAPAHQHQHQQQQQRQQQQHPQMRYYSQGGLGTPLDSPTRVADGAANSHPNSAMLQQGQPQWQQQPHSAQWASTPGSQSQQQQQHGNIWWDGAADPKNIDANMAMHSQHGELPYNVNSDGSLSQNAAGGLMIHMPQPRQGANGVNELALNAHTYLPPPVPPVPVPVPDSRPTRPPRAPSSGARHHHRNMSSSPMRKQRQTSASPSPGMRQSRNSSGASIASSSARSASGRAVSGSIPGTPSGVKKRRSRDAGTSGSFSAGEDGSGGISLGGGGGGGGGGIGFVNFTPNDGSVLMTGVAPSGSSKTKARREKEAQERRRRLSEAAMKAVAAAGGDIEKLREQGFEL